MNDLIKNNFYEVLDASVNMANQAIYWLSKEGKLLYANKNALDELNYSLEELQQLYVWDVDAIVDTKEKYLENVKKFENYGPDGQPNTIQSKHKRKNGETFPVEIVSKFKVIDAEEYVISYVKDITLRLQRTEDINFYFELINSSQDMIFLADHSTGDVVFVNETACNVLGYSLKELKEMKVSDFREPFKNLDNIELPDVFKQIEKDNDMKTFGVYKTRDGKKIPVETSLHLKEYHGKNYVVASSRDITDRLEIECEKEQLSKKLEEYNKTLKEEIEKSKQKLIEHESIMRKQSRMAAMGEMLENIAHQWRQPLSAVSTLATGIILQKDAGLLDKDEYQDGLNKINENIQYLSKTIDNFRDFFKPNKEKTYFNLDSLVSNAIELSKSRYNNIEIDFILNGIENKEIYSYENEVLQVVLNILNNALDELVNVEHKKYIFIEASVDRVFLDLRIKDNAGGVPKEIIERIFEPYFTTKHDYLGTGIGLYMSRNIIKHLKGNLDVENVIVKYNEVEYEGACFEIKIPLN